MVPAVPWSTPPTPPLITWPVSRSARGMVPAVPWSIPPTSSWSQVCNLKPSIAIPQPFHSLNPATIPQPQSRNHSAASIPPPQSRSHAAPVTSSLPYLAVKPPLSIPQSGPFLIWQGELAIKLLIPKWAAHPTVAVNGAAQPGVTAGTLFTLSRAWSVGDKISLTLCATAKSNPCRALRVGGAITLTLEAAAKSVWLTM